MMLSLTEGKKEERFRRLFEEYYAPFCLYAKQFVEDRAMREDIVSEVFTVVWEKLDEDSLNMDTALGYIKMSVRNRCLNLLKHQEYEWSYAEWQQHKAPIYASSPDSLYTAEELYGLLSDTLQKLPEHYRSVFLKSFIESKTHAEIADEMHLSVKSVNRYKQRVMAILKENFKDYMPFLLLAFALRQGR